MHSNTELTATTLAGLAKSILGYQTQLVREASDLIELEGEIDHLITLHKERQLSIIQIRKTLMHLRSKVGFEASRHPQLQPPTTAPRQPPPPPVDGDEWTSAA